jgi:2-haloacid dehalogenase
VAAHPEDLQAARKVGFKTAFISRPLEHGPDQKPRVAPPDVDVNAADLLDLAEKLGA